MNKIPNPLPTDTPKVTGVRLVTSERFNRGEKVKLHEYCEKWGLQVKYACKLAVAGAIPAECDKNTGTWWVRDTGNGPEVDLPIRPLYEGVEGFWHAPAAYGTTCDPELLDGIRQLNDHLALIAGVVEGATNTIALAMKDSAKPAEAEQDADTSEQLVLDEKPATPCFVPRRGRCLPNDAYIRYEAKRQDAGGYSLAFGASIANTLADTFGGACSVLLSDGKVHVTKPVLGMRPRKLVKGTTGGRLWIATRDVVENALPPIPAGVWLLCDFAPSRDADGNPSYIFTPRKSVDAS